jgi:isopentenyl-diphosphate Delta-isomerase
MQELIVLVDDNNNEIGTAPKLESHNANTPLHRAFSCYVFNAKGEFLLTQRALSKKVWPGIWTNSCCGHPGPGEPTEDAIKRRLQYELGIAPDTLELALPDFRYRTELNGIVENEICPVYIAKVSSDPQPNPEEVEEYRWLPWDEYVQKISDNPDGYSYWSVKQVEQLKDLSLLKKYYETA